jgi:hypothetical protein
MKKILFLVLWFISVASFGQLTLINTGTGANSGNGDNLRTAFTKTNSAITQVNTNTSAIALKANIASPTFTGTVAIPTLDVSGTIESGVNSGTGGQLKLYGSTSGNATLKVGAAAGTSTIFQLPATNGTNGYVLKTDGSGVTSWTATGDASAVEVRVDSIVTVLKDTVSARTVLSLQSDTIPYMVFGAGDGARGSQPSFLINKKLGAVYWKGSDTLRITEIRGVVVQDSGTVTSGIQLYYDANVFDGTPTAILSGTTNITSTAAGTVVTSFANAYIPPNKWVWATVLTKSNGNMPVFMSVTLSGWKQNRKY